MSRGLTVSLVLLLLACGDSPTDPPGDTPLASLELSATSGAPGSVLTVAGVDPAALVGEVVLQLGDAVASTGIGESGEVRAVVPLYMDAEGRLHDGVPIAESKGAFTVLPLPVAAGAAEATHDALATVVSGLRTLSDALEPTPGENQAWAEVTAEALEDLLTGEDERSLATQLDALAADPASLALLEGVLTTSGVLARLEAYADQVAAIAAAIEAPASGIGPARMTELSDFDLATKMQVYVMLREFGESVLAETSSEWSQTIGLVASTIGLVQGVPAVSTISAILTVSTFVVNKIALGYLPAEIDSFDLVLADSQVVAGEVAPVEVWIEASNDPAPITVLEMTSVVLSLMSFASSTDRETMRGIVANVASYFLGRMRSLLSAYGQAYPETGINPEIASIPELRWSAHVTDRRFVSPRTFTPAVIDSTGAGVLAWRAGAEASGEGRIYAAINTGPATRVIPELPGIEYNGGAFGEDVRNTATHTVVVGPELVAVATMAEEISEGGTNGLEVRAGTVTALGDTTWQAGLPVSLSVTGGSVDATTGSTGSDGRFDTFVTLGEGSDSVSVVATVTAANGFTAEATAVSRLEGAALIVNGSLPQFVEPGTPVTLEIQVRRQSAGGSPVEPYATVELFVTGGTATPASGAADEYGEWETELTIDDTAAELEVRVVAAAVAGEATGEITLNALNREQLPIRVTQHYGRYWLSAGVTGEPAYRRYSDNGRNPLAPVVGTSQRVGTAGTREGKTCNIVSDHVAQSTLQFDSITGAITEWTSSSDMDIVATATGLTGDDDPNCFGSAQHQLTLRFEITEGSWEVTWSGELPGEDRDLHANWRSYGFLRDANDITWESPPDQSPSGSLVLGAGTYSFFVNPRLDGNVSAPASTGGFTATGGHDFLVTFERVAPGS